VNIGITFSTPLILFLLSIVLVIGFTLFAYRRTLPPVSRFIHNLLLLLRGIAFCLICLIAFGGILRITMKKSEKADIAILIDASSSMRIKDNGIERGELARQLLLDPEINKLQNRYRVHPYIFSEDLKPLNSIIPDSIEFNGSATNITLALATLLSQKNDTPISGILLLSDGAHNHGESPVRAAEALGCPIFGITLGQTVQRPDLVITGTMTNDITYVGNRIPVEVSIRGPGYAGKLVSIILRSDSEVVDQESVTIPESGLEISRQLEFTPQKSGFQRLTVEVTRLEGEVTIENNFQEIFIKVLESKLRILMFTTAPDPDLTFLKRLLMKDENLNVTVRTQKKGGTFYEGPMVEEADMRSADVFILLDFPDRNTSFEIWDPMVRFLEQNQKPYLLIAGEWIDLKKLKVIESVLPCQFSQNRAERMLVPRLTPDGENHPLLRIHDMRDKNFAAWNSLPPIFSSTILGNPKPGSRLLAVGVPEKGSVSSVSEPISMIISRDLHGMRSLVIMGHGLYRWDLLMWGIGGSNEVLKGLVSNALRWLTIREEESPVRISTDKTVYVSGEEIHLSAQVYDELIRPVENAQVNVRLVSPTGEFSYKLNNAGKGWYKKSVRLFQSGQYRVFGEAFIQNRLAGKGKTEFSISSFNPDLLNTKANPQLMNTLAEVTDGKCVPPDSLFAIINTMDFSPRSVIYTREIELHRTHYILIIVIELITADRFIMKR
jgi:hypothetical protein